MEPLADHNGVARQAEDAQAERINARLQEWRLKWTGRRRERLWKISRESILHDYRCEQKYGIAFTTAQRAIDKLGQINRYERLLA